MSCGEGFFGIATGKHPELAVDVLPGVLFVNTSRCVLPGDHTLLEVQLRTHDKNFPTLSTIDPPPIPNQPKNVTKEVDIQRLIIWFQST